MAKKTTKKTSNNLCEGCGGRCCRYIAFPLDNPETKKDYDDIRWYLCHKGISVFVEDGQWYASISTNCRHLCSDTGKCKIYDNRPKICREFDPSGCEYRSEEYGYELHFTDDKQMQDYIKIKFDNNKIPKR
jgi:uncharacterized protein